MRHPDVTPHISLPAARSALPETRNPVLKLAGVQTLLALPDADRAVMAAHLKRLRLDALAKADVSWKRNCNHAAPYWKAAGVYAGHIFRLLNAGKVEVPQYQPVRADRSPNPIVQLQGAAGLLAMDAASRQALAGLLDGLRADAGENAHYCWSKHKSPMAAYWKHVARHAGYTARRLRRG